MPFSREHELLLQKVERFTNTEVGGLEMWLIAAMAGRYELSLRLNTSGLYLEHYQSVLDFDPEKWTEEQVVSLDTFTDAFERDVKEFQADPLVDVAIALRSIAQQATDIAVALIKAVRGDAVVARAAIQRRTA